MHGVSYAVMRAYVADRKPKIRVEAGRGAVNVFFRKTHRPAADAEVEFGEVAINLRGEIVNCMLFAFRLSFSGEAVHKILRPEGRRHSWKDTSTHSPRLAVSRPARSATTICGRRSPRSSGSSGNGAYADLMVMPMGLAQKSRPAQELEALGPLRRRASRAARRRGQRRGIVGVGWRADRG
jgi:hypothetical protein